jgi:mono/diheme cytochrome c family protein
MNSLLSRDRKGAVPEIHCSAPRHFGANRPGAGFSVSRLIPALVLAAVALTATGCARSDMQDQPKYKPQRPSEFFADGRDGRPELDGTIARGELNEDAAYYNGKDAAAKDIDAFPLTVDKALIERGRQRYDIYCSPCHGRLGNGMGMVVQRGFKQPPSYHIERLRNAPVGHFYDVITNGYGAMLNYSQQIQVRDRWAIVAYIRALQYSQNANASDLSTEARAKLPPAGQAMPGDMKDAMEHEPMAPADKDFMNFPAQPATPSGVPGAMGAGIYKSQPDAAAAKAVPAHKSQPETK